MARARRALRADPLRLAHRRACSRRPKPRVAKGDRVRGGSLVLARLAERVRMSEPPQPPTRGEPLHASAPLAPPPPPPSRAERRRGVVSAAAALHHREPLLRLLRDRARDARTTSSARRSAIVVARLCDALDGRVARLANATSRFGARVRLDRRHRLLRRRARDPRFQRRPRSRSSAGRAGCSRSSTRRARRCGSRAST